MKTKLAISLIGLIVLLMACGKDKFTTIPQVEIKSISPKTVSQGDIIEFRSKYTDQEGDIDSISVVYRWYDATTFTRSDTFHYLFDQFKVPGKLRDGEIVVTFSYGRQLDGFQLLPGSPVNKDTTSTLGLILTDKAGNKSDYKESDRIRLLKP